MTGTDPEHTVFRRRYRVEYDPSHVTLFDVRAGVERLDEPRLVVGVSNGEDESPGHERGVEFPRNVHAL